MDGNLINGSVKLNSGRIDSSGSAGGGGSKNPVFQEGLGMYVGSAGDSRRSWRIMISPQSIDQNALIVQFKDKQATWQTASVFLAHETGS